MIRHSQIFRGLIFAFALALAALPGLAQNGNGNGKGNGHEKGGPKMDKGKPGKDMMKEMWVKLMAPSIGGYGKNGGDLKYSWKYNLAKGAKLNDSWATVKVWYNDDKLVERRENISLESGSDSIKLPPKGDYYPVRYDIVMRANYTWDGTSHYMEDKMSGKLPRVSEIIAK